MEWDAAPEQPRAHARCASDDAPHAARALVRHAPHATGGSGGGGASHRLKIYSIQHVKVQYPVLSQDCNLGPRSRDKTLNNI